MSVTFYPNLIQYAGFDPAVEPSVLTQVVTSSGGETGDPAYDALDNRRTNTLSLDTNGETDSAVIQIDTTNPITCNFAIIDNHNLKTADAKYFLKQGGVVVTVSAAYSGAYGTDLTADSVASNIATVAADGISLLLFGASLDNTWAFEIDDVATFDADVTLGELVVGNAFAPAFNPELQPTFGYDLPGSSYRESEGGQRYGFSTHTNERRAWHFQWKYMSDANRASLENVFLYTGGIKNPFYIDLGPILGATNPQLYYVRFMRPLRFRGLTKDAWQVDIYIEEEI